MTNLQGEIINTSIKQLFEIINKSIKQLFDSLEQTQGVDRTVLESTWALIVDEPHVIVDHKIVRIRSWKGAQPPVRLPQELPRPLSRVRFL